MHPPYPDDSSRRPDDDDDDAMGEEAPPTTKTTKTSLTEEEEAQTTETPWTLSFPPATSSQTTAAPTSIATLRQLLANDIVRDDPNHPYTMITSPFRLPQQKQNQQNQNHQQKHTHIHLPLVYADHTASHRPSTSVETYLHHTVLPLYGNTHTHTSVTGRQSTAFVAEARQLVGEACGGGGGGATRSSPEVVLFCGHGTTAAVDVLLDVLGLREWREETTTTDGARDDHDDDTRPVIFVGPMEHHSNLVPWRETGCEIVSVPLCPVTHTVDVAWLDRTVGRYRRADQRTGPTPPRRPPRPPRLLVGTFAAASNVTGRVAPLDDVAVVLHRHGALCVVDAATSASYNCNFQMQPRPTDTQNNNNQNNNNNHNHPYAYKDAMVWSPHKWLGGAGGTPGVLIVRKDLVSRARPPRRSGGGTVFYVSHEHHRFLSHRVERYEGGTPNVTGAVKVGLACVLKRQAEWAYRQCVRNEQEEGTRDGRDTAPRSILEDDLHTHRRVVQYLRTHAPNLVLLGVSDDYGKTTTPTTSAGSTTTQASSARHLPIFSFLIRFGPRFLHYNYVCAILNDVFGIQSRGGCQCAGPYSQRLLGLTELVRDHHDDHDDDNLREVPNRWNKRVEDALYRFKERAELLRPGYSRLSLPFKGMRAEEVDYVVQALVWVARHGWALACQYRCNHRTGEWRHASRQGTPLGKGERRWLSHYEMGGGGGRERNSDSGNTATPSSSQGVATPAEILNTAMKNADAILAAAKKDHRSISEASRMADAHLVLGNDDDDARLEELRWYVYPKECATVLLNGGTPPPFANVALLGALRPNAVPQVVSATKEKDVSNRRKRKPSEDPTLSIRSEAPGKPVSSTAATLLVFRDGEHTGSASYREIKEGIDDGELSEVCEVFDNSSNQWTIFQQASDKDVKSSSDRQKNKHALNVGTEQKKAARTSASWGHRSVEHPSAGQATTEAAPPAVPMDIGPPIQSPVPAKTIPPASSAASSKKKRFQHVRPPPKMMRMATQAIVQWEMIKEGDRLLLGLSGGKDSLSLLHCLLEFRRKLPIHFDIEVCTIDPMTPSFDPSPLIPYVESLGLQYHFIRDDIVSRASKSGKDGKTVSSLCAYCARMKRGNLYSCARRNKCNKLVLAQHLDDCAESVMMSMMHNGFLRTMKANYAIDAGDISVIRPLIYCRESLMTDFAKAKNLPVINENCPACFEEPKERARVKKMLSREETLYPNFYDNVRRSLIPLMHDDMSAILRSYTEEAIARSRKVPYKGPKGPRTFTSSGDKSAESNATPADADVAVSLRDASEEDLVRELARRRALKFNLNAASKTKPADESGIPDLTGQMCTLNGGNGSIPCRELME